MRDHYNGWSRGRSRGNGRLHRRLRRRMTRRRTWNGVAAQSVGAPAMGIPKVDGSAIGLASSLGGSASARMQRTRAPLPSRSSTRATASGFRIRRRSRNRRAVELISFVPSKNNGRAPSHHSRLVAHPPPPRLPAHHHIIRGWPRVILFRGCPRIPSPPRPQPIASAGLFVPGAAVCSRSTPIASVSHVAFGLAVQGVRQPREN